MTVNANDARKIDELNKEVEALKEQHAKATTRDEKALLSVNINRVRAKIKYYKNREECIAKIKENRQKNYEKYKAYNVEYGRKRREMANKEELREYNRKKKQESRARINNINQQGGNDDSSM